MKTKGIYFLYRVLQALGLPVLTLYFLFRGLLDRRYLRSLPQRFGFLPRSFRQTGPGAIWLHAVSVGEVLACVETLRGLRAALPRTALFVSTSTLAGREMAERKLTALADGVFFAPVDYVFAVRRVLRTLRPSVVVVAETEIWPNWIREVARTGAGLTIINGRISDRALPRYQRFRWFFQTALCGVDSILAQSEAMRDRFIALGAPEERVRAAGNLKYDFEARAAAPDSPVRALLASTRPGAVWIAASTMPPAEPGDVDEDDAVLAAFRQAAQRRPDLMLVLAPRKPERFDAAARKLEAAGLRYARRSALAEYNGGRPQVLLLDTIGELSGVFALGDVVFMGGSLAKRGGHNILEPALFGKPVIAGPHMENFQAIADDFRGAGAWVEIKTSGELAEALERLLDNAEEAREIGRRALACAEARRGAAARAVSEVCELHSREVPRYRPAMPWFAVAWALSAVWKWGGQIKQARAFARLRKLDVPVISIGNLTMGGTGKTPCALRLAALLKEHGRAPGILTRGYARSSPQKQLALEAGATVSADRSGDEPQIFVRSGIAPVGIGADRFQSGRLLRREFRVDTLLLDDGFQHVRLGRDVDIVLLDALEPFGRGGVFPLGRLREPPSALARADIVVITRSAFSDLGEAVERTVRRWNARAPVFRASVAPRAWVEWRSGVRFDLDARPFERAGAFCGLGNPQAFRRTLEGVGVHPVEWVEFPDHHRYRPDEVRRMAHQFASKGATAFATTEKDAVNLCDPADELAAPLAIYWLEVCMQIEREHEFLREIEKRIG